jgi:hypothetical protein
MRSSPLELVMTVHACDHTLTQANVKRQTQPCSTCLIILSNYIVPTTPAWAVLPGPTIKCRRTKSLACLNQLVRDDLPKDHAPTPHMSKITGTSILGPMIQPDQLIFYLVHMGGQFYCTKGEIVDENVEYGAENTKLKIFRFQNGPKLGRRTAILTRW